MQPSSDPSDPEPRLWLADLAALRPGAGAAIPAPAPAFEDPTGARLARWSGMGLALAHLLRTEPDRLGLVLALGHAVRLGLPAAARATVLGPSRLTGGLAEGLVGSDLARRLAAVCDVLAVEGTCSTGDGVLVVERGGLRLERQPDWAGLSPDERWTAAQQRFGDCALLRGGPAAGGDRPVAFANLAAGGVPASFVGRGLGGALARHGLLAIVVRSEPDPAETEAKAAGDAGLHGLLLRSPRLAARAEGGTLELAGAFAARGALLADDEAEALSKGADRARTGRHGCKGCPTPCGWVFESEGAASGARFSAVQALGTPLGLAGFEGPAALLQRCNRLGIDAKEAGAGLELLVRAGEAGLVEGAPCRGDLAALAAALEDLAAGRGAAVVLTDGASEAARRLGLPLASSGDEAVRDGGDLGALLGACLGIRGAEPMRTFPFLLEGGAGAERLERLLMPWSLPAGAEDPLAPQGTGRVVAWHEDLVAGIDLTGFCAFSAAGLLADDVCGLDGLAEAVAPASIVGEEELGSTPGERLLSAGASLLVALRLIRRRAGGRPRQVPEWARARLDAAGVGDEYRVLRCLDAAGELQAGAEDRIGLAAIRVAPPRVERELSAGTQPDGSLGSRDRRMGRVTLAAQGALGRRLEAPLVLECELPASVAEILELAAGQVPAAADWLVRGGRPLPGAWRAGALLGAGESVHDGDLLELVLAISGG